MQLLEGMHVNVSFTKKYPERHEVQIALVMHVEQGELQSFIF